MHFVQKPVAGAYVLHLAIRIEPAIMCSAFVISEGLTYILGADANV